MKCKKCGKSFLTRVKIEGKYRTLNKRSFCLDCSPFKSNNRKDLTISDEERKEKYKTYRRELFKQRRKKFKLKIDQYKLKIGACQWCTWNKHPIILQFHHRKPENKSFQFSTGNLGFRSWKKIEEEMAKCDLICPNCHMFHHYQETSEYAN